MALTLSQLLAAPTVDAWRSLLLGGIKGLGIVVSQNTTAGFPAGNFNPAVLGTGNLTLSGTPIVSIPKVIINITTAGEPGAAIFQYSLNGGTSFVSGITVPSTNLYTLPGTGVIVSFNAGIVGAGTSFAVNDQYTFALVIPTSQVTAWAASSGYRQLVEIEAQALAALSAQQAALAAGGYITSATGSWADLIANGFYNIYRNAATVTAGQATLTNITTNTYTVSVGNMWFSSTTGLLYNNTTGGTLYPLLVTPSLVSSTPSTASGTLAAGTHYYRVSAVDPLGHETLACAESPVTLGAPGKITLVWNTVTNATAYRVYVSTSSGTETYLTIVGAVTTFVDDGTFTPSGSIVPPTSNSTGTLFIQVVAQAPGSIYNLPNGTMIQVTAGTLAGVTVSNPDPGTGTWITTAGTDAEFDFALATRCQAQWPALGTGATALVYSAWALTAEKAAGHATTIIQTLVLVDPTIAGQVDIYCSGAIGSVGSQPLADVLAYIQPRTPLTASILILSVSNVAVAVAGQVNYFTSRTTAAGAAAAVSGSLQSLFNLIAVGKDSVPSIKVYYTAITGAITNPLGETGGAQEIIQNVTGLLVNGGTADIGLTLGQKATLTVNLTYVGV